MSKKILIIGDSWATGSEGDTGENRGWVEILGVSDEYRQGINGSTASEWMNNADKRLTTAIFTPADIVIISLLGNDALSANANGDITTDEVICGIHDLRLVVKKMQRKTTMVMLYADPYCGENPQSRIVLPMLNTAIRWACRDMDIIFIETYNVLTSDHFDGVDIHPNRAGHVEIAKLIMQKILNEGGAE